MKCYPFNFSSKEYYKLRKMTKECKRSILSLNLASVTCKSQQSFRKPQVLQKCAHGQTKCHGQKGPSVTYFGSVSNHSSKKFHFYGKFIFPCFTSNKITWELGRNDWKVRRGKAESYENVSCITVSLVGDGQVCLLFAFFF